VTSDRDKFPAVVIMVMNLIVLQNSPNFLLAEEMSSSLIKYSSKIFEMLRNTIFFFCFLSEILFHEFENKFKRNIHYYSRWNSL